MPFEKEINFKYLLISLLITILIIIIVLFPLLNIIKTNNKVENKTLKEKKIIKNKKNIKQIIKKEKTTFLLKIETIPKTAKIKILNIKPKFHQNIRLKKGKYKIEVSEKRYKTIITWIEIKNKNLKVKIKLKKQKVETNVSKLFKEI